MSGSATKIVLGETSPELSYLGAYLPSGAYLRNAEGLTEFQAAAQEAKGSPSITAEVRQPADQL